MSNYSTCEACPLFACSDARRYEMDTTSNPAEGPSGKLIGYAPVRSFAAFKMDESRTEASDGDLEKSALGILSDVLLYLSSRILRSPA